MKVANVLSILLTVVLGLIAAQWIISPESAALSLNMPYLEGDARNTQVRDFTAFFSWHFNNGTFIIYNKTISMDI